MMTAVVPDKVTPVRMLDYGTFAPTSSIAAGQAYLLPPGPGTKVAMEKLRRHGIELEELMAPAKVDAQVFVISKVSRITRAFLGGREVTLSGAYETKAVEFPPGTLVVPVGQPLGTLAAYLLEPESDDGLTTWGFFDGELAVGKEYPVRKLVKPANLQLGNIRWVR